LTKSKKISQPTSHSGHCAAPMLAELLRHNREWHLALLGTVPARQ
jgi:stress response protein SCP2